MEVELTPLQGRTNFVFEEWLLNTNVTGNEKLGSIKGGWVSRHLSEYQLPKDFMQLVC
jgi:hypothetical protein